MVAEGYEGVLVYFGCAGWLKRVYKKVEHEVIEMVKMTKSVGRDPRRIIHSIKVASAITLASFFYYFKPLYDSFGASAIWAIITVIVVFEFSVGATIGKGLNRMIATILGGALGFGTHYLANLCGDKGLPLILGALVFVVAAIATFMRFFPSMKARYDYGLLIFILTFSMVAVSSYRDDEVLKLASDRFLTIVIGSFIAVSICIFVCPIWIGNDLHDQLVNNVENLATFLQEFGAQYFRSSQGVEQVNKASMHKYKTILTSKQSEESMANLARWEPGPRKFGFRHPWKQYLNISSSARECAYRVRVLDVYLKNNDQIQIESQFKEEFLRMCKESAKALKEVAMAIKKMAPPALASAHIERAKATTENLSSLLANHRFEGLEMIPTATLVSLLIDLLCCIEKVADCTRELGCVANLRRGESLGAVVPAADQDLINV
ncbi:Aluminum-activated malate transporter 2, partial [Cucurbita argyrosperma subsp. argyrosperma]